MSVGEPTQPAAMQPEGMQPEAQQSGVSVLGVSGSVGPGSGPVFRASEGGYTATVSDDAIGGSVSG